ncbi:unnamed protein product [Darwinula stevensoni]|uniref:3-hydroxyanthranilate 3,4-dioxygenase n=1 Tax=Darwinula stevensoni TaxID=69355 RepID=A0A7R8XGF9_9CRUS|nr:unnamed protein product [Darwinula stevensoni]CAG0891442.1 unnamed protein product [Darwinula stevensoni]
MNARPRSVLTASSPRPRSMEKAYNRHKEWIEENSKFFLPPICNKMMHQDSQLKIFYVGGPNQREDFHLEEGEEFFYQREGDMVLRIMERGRFKDVKIKEGQVRHAVVCDKDVSGNVPLQVFMLPGRIPHSPQRWADTLGLVIERERLPEEKDGLRYFVNGTPSVLYERWFYCEDLGTQLGPLIQEFMDSKARKTGVSQDGDVLPSPPWQPDDQTRVEDPFYLQDWLAEHRDEIERNGKKRLFASSYASDIDVLGRGAHAGSCGRGDTWLYCIEGSASVRSGGEEQPMEADASLRIAAGTPWSADVREGGLVLSVVMDPTRKR